MSRSKDNWLDDVWYGGSAAYRLLLPLTWLFASLVAVRRLLYATRILPTSTVGAPVIVVGNVAAGGTGKTPVVIWLAKALRHRGYSPGIVSRGYRGTVGPRPIRATADSDPAIVGDEAILLATQGECPVVVHPDRVAAARMVVELGADVVLSDDGLQHYRLGRDFEIAVVDASRGFGNGRLLPAGPLREPVSRLHQVDRMLLHRGPDDGREALGRSTDVPVLEFTLRVMAVSRLDGSEVRHIDDFAGQTVHALAGIGHPERFFRMLEGKGIVVKRHPLADHADIGPEDVDFDDELAVLMTAKDAVKCRWFDTSRCWYVPVEVVFEEKDAEMLLEEICSTFNAWGLRDRG